MPYFLAGNGIWQPRFPGALLWISAHHRRDFPQIWKPFLHSFRRLPGEEGTVYIYMENQPFYRESPPAARLKSCHKHFCNLPASLCNIIHTNESNTDVRNSQPYRFNTMISRLLLIRQALAVQEFLTICISFIHGKERYSVNSTTPSKISTSPFSFMPRPPLILAIGEDGSSLLYTSSLVSPLSERYRAVKYGCPSGASKVYRVLAWEMVRITSPVEVSTIYAPLSLLQRKAYPPFTHSIQENSPRTIRAISFFSAKL